jgi:hypothetical protein
MLLFSCYVSLLLHVCWLLWQHGRIVLFLQLKLKSKSTPALPAKLCLTECWLLKIKRKLECKHCPTQSTLLQTNCRFFRSRNPVYVFLLLRALTLHDHVDWYFGSRFGIECLILKQVLNGCFLWLIVKIKIYW